MLNELSQTKKDKCYMISLKWRIKKVEFKEAEREEVIEGGQGLRGLGQEAGSQRCLRPRSQVERRMVHCVLYTWIVNC